MLNRVAYFEAGAIALIAANHLLPSTAVDTTGVFPAHGLSLRTGKKTFLNKRAYNPKRFFRFQWSKATPESEEEELNDSETDGEAQRSEPIAEANNVIEEDVETDEDRLIVEFYKAKRSFEIFVGEYTRAAMKSERVWRTNQQWANRHGRRVPESFEKGWRFGERQREENAGRDLVRQLDEGLSETLLAAIENLPTKDRRDAITDLCDFVDGWVAYLNKLDSRWKNPKSACNILYSAELVVPALEAFMKEVEGQRTMNYGALIKAVEDYEVDVNYEAFMKKVEVNCTVKFMDGGEEKVRGLDRWSTVADLKDEILEKSGTQVLIYRPSSADNEDGEPEEDDTLLKSFAPNSESGRYNILVYAVPRPAP